MFFSRDIGIDLGTANTLVYMRGKGIVMREPSVVAVDLKKDEVMAVGTEAKEMIGRTPGSISAIRPLKDGVIADFDVTAAMLRHFIKAALKATWAHRPRLIVCIPSGVTEVERRAVEDAARQAGARNVELIEEPMAAAIGAGLQVEEAAGCMVVDIGGGTSEIAVISLGDIVTFCSVRTAGDDFDDAIVSYIKKKYNLLIGERTAEDIKIKIGSAFPYEDEGQMDVKGRNLVDGLPKNITITAEEVREALGFRDRRCHPFHAGAHAPRAERGHHHQRHHADRRRRAAARTGSACFPRDRHAGACGGESARLRCDRHGQMPGSRHGERLPLQPSSVKTNFDRSGRALSTRFLAIYAGRRARR